MKIRNGQSKQQIQKKQNQSLFFNHQTLLNQMYDRVCSQQKSNIQQFENIKPLHSYLSISGQTSQVQEKVISPHVDPNVIPLSSQEEELRHHNSYLKKYSMQERIKTDMQEINAFQNEQLQTLRIENEMLRKKLIKCEKKIIRLQSFESEVEYLKKISYLQHAEIQKLRITLRNIQLQQVQTTIDNLRSIESQPKSFKQNNLDKNIVISTEGNVNTQNIQKKKGSCIPKDNISRKDKENDGRCYRTHSVFFQTKNKQTIDRGAKGCNFQQKSSKLKNKKTIMRLD